MLKGLFGRKRKEPLVFLAGTCGNNYWRLLFLDEMTEAGILSSYFFNPQVNPGQWGAEREIEENKAKEHATHYVFYIGDPKQGGNEDSSYSYVEAAITLAQHPGKTVIVIDTTELSGHALKAAEAIKRLLRMRYPDAPIFDTLDEGIEETLTMLDAYFGI